MNEKDMVNDILSQTNTSLSIYAGVIAEAANPELRQTIQDIRNSLEQFQYQLFKCAQDKNYYRPAQMATQQEIETVKSLFN